MTQTDTPTRPQCASPASVPLPSVSIAPVVHDRATPRPERVQAAVSAPAPARAPAPGRTAVVHAPTRASRRSRLLAAHAAASARAEAEGRKRDVSAETRTFIEALRADIARAALRSERPSMLRYVLRRSGLRRVTTLSVDAITLN